MAKISELYFYPIKSMRGLRARSLEFDRLGPKWDRLWMIVDENREFISQRERPDLAKIGVRMDEDIALELSLGGLGQIDFGLEEREGDELKVRVRKDEMSAFEVSREVSQWLSDALKAKVKLVRLDEGTMRNVRFVDSASVLVISTASLRELEQRSGARYSMARFRPNIVVDEVLAHAEDQWTKFKVGATEFAAIKPCSRCKIITVHPLTGETGPEPLKTLATYRRQEKGIMFGAYFAHSGNGRITVGDSF